MTLLSIYDDRGHSTSFGDVDPLVRMLARSIDSRDGDKQG